MDKNAIALGLRIGRILAGQRRKRVPVAFLYNGVRLPALPEWDRSVYPYAVISIRTNSAVYNLAFTKSPIMSNADGSLKIGMTGTPSGLDKGEFENFKLSDGVWVSGHQGGVTVSRAVWSNNDLYYSADAGGGLFMAGSEPVPVYE